MQVYNLVKSNCKAFELVCLARCLGYVNQNQLLTKLEEVARQDILWVTCR